MQVPHLIVRDTDGLIIGTLMLPDPDAGPVRFSHDAPAGFTLMHDKFGFTREGRTDTEVAYLRDCLIEWTETASIAQLRAKAVEAIDAAGETLRLAIIARPTQTEEYRRVEAQARAWAAAGYPEGEGVDVPRGVTGWAQAKYRDGWTNRQACDDILATADVWLSVLDTIRDLRLVNKEDVRHALDADTIRTIVADMRTDMHAIAQQLNITLTEQHA